MDEVTLGCLKDIWIRLARLENDMYARKGHGMSPEDDTAANQRAEMELVLTKLKLLNQQHR